MKKIRKMETDLSGLNFQGMRMDNSDLSRGKLIKTDLSNAILWNSKVNDADLRQAVLHGADMRDGSFVRSDFREANLEGANLVQANVNRADFTQANLANSNLSSANLRHCKLQGANFSGVDLTNADLEFATGYTAAQLGEALSLHQTTGISHRVVDELLTKRPKLFETPPWFVHKGSTPTVEESQGNVVLRTLKAMFSLTKSKGE